MISEGKLLPTHGTLTATFRIKTMTDVLKVLADILIAAEQEQDWKELEIIWEKTAQNLLFFRNLDGSFSDPFHQQSLE